MCGIAGYYGPEELDPARIRSCLGLMGRRGPDAAGSYRHVTPGGRHVDLLHSRLGIIDLDPRSNQPFRDGTRVIAFNGEIYNYLEMKSRLESAGRSFRTNGDTEVLIAALGEHGTGALDQCDGMWAFACFDEADGTLILSRDRFGEKPLYIHSRGGGIFFGSEIKFILALSGGAPDLNEEKLRRYLVNGYRALFKENDSYFRGVESLPVATVETIDARGVRSNARYWDFRFRPDDQMGYADAVEELRSILIDSVKLRLRADVPIAFCMSGGIDSNSLVAIAKKRLGYDVHGFTIANTDSRYEEMELVDLAVGELGIRHTPIRLSTEGFLPKLRGLVEYHDSPVATISYYVHWLLMQSVKDHGYKISVSGTAADELFTGYYDHHLAYLKEVETDPGLYGVSLEAWRRHILPVVRNPHFQDPRLFSSNPSFRGHLYMESDGFSEYLRQPWSEAFSEGNFTSDLLRNRMLNEMFHEVVPMILHEDDLNAMYFSIENRSPFLSRDLFEFSLRVPTRHLIRDGYTKALLRDAMSGTVPEPILRKRQKVGFNAPVLDLLDVKSPAVREYLLDEGPIFSRIDRAKIERLIGKPSISDGENKFLFSFLSAKTFLEAFRP
jgi:asparagine synthase (glutamine-hydrolysing)